MKKVQEDWKEEMLQVGVLTNTHGVRGEVKVYPTTDDVMRFKKLKQVFLDTGKEPMELQVTQARFFKNLVILKFKEFDKCFIKKGDMQYSNKMLNISIFKANNGIFVF